MSNEKSPGCLGYIGDYTTQLCGDYNKPLQGSLLNNQYFMESRRFFFVAQISTIHIFFRDLRVLQAARRFTVLHCPFRKVLPPADPLWRLSRALISWEVKKPFVIWDYVGDYTTLYWDWCWQLKYFWNFYPEPWGRCTQFDEHIFQMGWNHQLDWDWLR